MFEPDDNAPLVACSLAVWGRGKELWQRGDKAFRVWTDRPRGVDPSENPVPVALIVDSQ